MSAPSTAERYCPSCERSYHEGKLCPEDGTELVVLARDSDPLVGRSLNDRYTVKQKIGAGGMGTVYRGTQHSVGRDVAIKVVNPALVTNPEAVKRFLREAKLSSRFSHPNAVSILDFGQTADGLFYLVMEHLAGRTLDDVLRQEHRLRLGRTVRIADQICDALEGAHRQQIVHRDLKPANVMLLDGSEGRDLIKVLDFGLAKSLSPDTTTDSMTMSGALLGTPAYMPPEAATGQASDERGDLYSLGVMLYVLLAGRLPFQADTVHALLAMQVNATPPPLVTVPAPIAAVVMKLLAKEPAERYPSAAATRQALTEAALPFLSLELQAATEPTLPGRERAAPPLVAPDAPTVVSDAAAAVVPVASLPPAPARRWIIGAALLAAGGAAAVVVALTNASAPTPPPPLAREPSALPAVAVDAAPGVDVGSGPEVERLAADAAAPDAARPMPDARRASPPRPGARPLRPDAAERPAPAPPRPDAAAPPPTPDAAGGSPIPY